MDPLEQIVKKHFGVTDDLREAGYILSDGTFIDLSGRHYAADHVRRGDRFVPRRGPDYLKGHRYVDHRELPEEIWDKAGGDNNTETMINFLTRTGALRVFPGTGFAAYRMPSVESLSAFLKGWRKAYGSEQIIVDISREGHRTEAGTLQDPSLEDLVEVLQTAFERHGLSGPNDEPGDLRPLDVDLKNYVRDFASVMSRHGRPDLKYGSMFDFMLREGGIADPTPYTAAEERTILRAFDRIGHVPEIKQCFYNAQSLALADALGYAEGYIAAAGVPVPLEHAWNTLPSGKAVDVTIRPRGERNTSDPKKLLERAKRNQRENSYFGVPLPSRAIRDTWFKTGQARMLLGEPWVLEQIFEKGYPKNWRSPSMGARRGMERDWLEEPEGHDKGSWDITRSPFEGDIPPWGQVGYEGYFPLEGKVFYLVAYVGDRPLGQKQTDKPITMKGMPITDVGSFPSGKSFGSQFMFHPIAAIPIRKEEARESGYLVPYLQDLIKSTGLFGKIIRMESFPEADMVELLGNKWFPVAKDAEREWPGISYANAYSENRLYGGHEEGGWWYDTGRPIASIPYPKGDEEAEERWRRYLEEKVGWTSEHGTGSVLGHDVFGVRMEPWFAEEYPRETPRYQ